MTTSALIITVALGVSVLLHLALMFVRGWLIAEVRREQNKMKVEWQHKQVADEAWKNDTLALIRKAMLSPWDVKRTA